MLRNVYAKSIVFEKYLKIIKNFFIITNLEINTKLMSSNKSE